MIIQVRGTSGSGKSTVVREVMKNTGLWKPKFKEGRKKPLYYSQGIRAILGHYETPCGGCDTIGSARKVYELIRDLQENMGYRVFICEGLLLSEDTKWSSQLEGLRVVYLTTPIEDCIKRVKSRRLEMGNEKPLKEDNTRRRVEVIERSRLKLEGLGVRCVRAASTRAPKLTLKWLNKGID